MWKSARELERLMNECARDGFNPFGSGPVPILLRSDNQCDARKDNQHRCTLSNRRTVKNTPASLQRVGSSEMMSA